MDSVQKDHSGCSHPDQVCKRARSKYPDISEPGQSTQMSEPDQITQISGQDQSTQISGPDQST